MSILIKAGFVSVLVEWTAPSSGHKHNSNRLSFSEDHGNIIEEGIRLAGVSFTSDDPDGKEECATSPGPRIQHSENEQSRRRIVQGSDKPGFQESDTPEIQCSVDRAIQKTQVSESPDIQRSGHPQIQNSEKHDIQKSINPEIQKSGESQNPKSSYLGILKSRKPGIGESSKSRSTNSGPPPPSQDLDLELPPPRQAAIRESTNPAIRRSQRPELLAGKTYEFLNCRILKPPNYRARQTQGPKHHRKLIHKATGPQRITIHR